MDPLGSVFPFLIGVLSFFSPCAFPLAPGYIGYLMGGREEPSLTRGTLYGIICLIGVLTSAAILGFTATVLRGLFTEMFF